MQPGRNSRSVLFGLVLLAVMSLACLVVPIYVIRPFRQQGPMELRVALFVKEIGPWLSLACAGLALAIAFANRRRVVGWRWRSATLVVLVLTIGGVFLARLNIYELMFHPIDAPQFDTADRVKVEADDMVIAVRVNGAARAYPVREMAYHHVVNDRLGNEPITATY
jgi:hypothetical protein